MHSDDALAYYRITLPLAFSADTPSIMEAAAEIGRDAGLDDDWVPESLEEACYEILISAGNLDAVMAHGVIPLPRMVDTPQAGALFSILLDLGVTEDDREMAQMSRLLPRDWPDTLDACVVAVLMSPSPPLDHGVEIIGHAGVAGTSQHERMARFEKIVSRQGGAERA